MKYSIIQIWSLGVEDLELKHPIYIGLNHIGLIDYTASFLEAGIMSSGDSIEEAIENLQDTLVHKFFELSFSGTDFGKKLCRQRNILNDAIERVSAE